jgi:hypothetical protein
MLERFAQLCDELCEVLSNGELVVAPLDTPQWRPVPIDVKNTVIAVLALTLHASLTHRHSFKTSHSLQTVSSSGFSGFDQALTNP